MAGAMGMGGTRCAPGCESGHSRRSVEQSGIDRRFVWRATVMACPARGLKAHAGRQRASPLAPEGVDGESRNTSPRPSPQSGEGGERPWRRRLARRFRGSSATREETRRTPPAKASVEQLAAFLVGGFTVGEDLAAVVTGGDFAIWSDQTFVGADAAPAQAGDVAGCGFEFERFNVSVVHGVMRLVDSA